MDSVLQTLNELTVFMFLDRHLSGHERAAFANVVIKSKFSDRNELTKLIPEHYLLLDSCQSYCVCRSPVPGVGVIHDHCSNCLGNNPRDFHRLGTYYTQWVHQAYRDIAELRAIHYEHKRRHKQSPG